MAEPNKKVEMLPYSDKMKNIILIISFLFTSYIGISQIKVDPRIQNYLGEEIIQKIVTEHPERMDYYNNFLYHSYKMINQEEVNDKEENVIEELPVLPLKNGTQLNYEEVEKQIKNGTFDIFQVDLKRNKMTNRYFKIGNSTKIFVLLAIDKL